MKIILTLPVLLFASFSNAQENFDTNQLHNIPGKFVEIPAQLIFLWLIVTFIITLVKLFLDYRLKNKLIEKGVSESALTLFLKSNKKDTGRVSIKWFAILISIGIGLTLISFLPRFGIHSLIIMTFCIATGFLGYYFFEKRQDANNLH